MRIWVFRYSFRLPVGPCRHILWRHLNQPLNEDWHGMKFLNSALILERGIMWETYMLYWGKQIFYLGAFAIYLSDLSELLAAASIAAAAAASLPTFTIFCSRKIRSNNCCSCFKSTAEQVPWVAQNDLIQLLDKTAYIYYSFLFVCFLIASLYELLIQTINVIIRQAHEHSKIKSLVFGWTHGIPSPIIKLGNNVAVHRQ